MDDGEHPGGRLGVTVEIRAGDARALLAAMPSGSVHAIVTSPPYFGLRRYLPDDHPDKGLEMGSEPTLGEFIGALVEVMREARRVLRDNGVAFVNMGDGYSGSMKGSFKSTDAWDNFLAKSYETGNTLGQRAPTIYSRASLSPDGMRPKNLMMVPARLAMALQDDGWVLRSQMPWIKRKAMPESVTDRPSSAIEYVFQFAKSSAYYWDAEAVKIAGALPAGTKGGKASAARAGETGVNSRPAEYATYSGTRNFRNSDLFFSSLEAPHGLLTDADGNPLALDVNTAAFAEAHFATFPPNLVEPLIKAATSERGCCAACGAPWVRLVEKSRTFESGSGRAGNLPEGKNGASMQGGGETRDIRRGPVVHSTTAGWGPTCACTQVAPVPCRVLDPFGGAGTTGLVAQRLGRDAILLELNPEYAAMAERRLAGDRGELPIEGEPGTLFAVVA